MAREVVTGYCWPQSVQTGDQLSVHLSSSGGRPVRVEVARVGAQRDVVFRSDTVVADEHETPKGASSEGCGWPVALTLDVEPGAPISQPREHVAYRAVIQQCRCVVDQALRVLEVAQVNEEVRDRSPRAQAPVH